MPGLGSDANRPSDFASPMRLDADHEVPHEEAIMIALNQLREYQSSRPAVNTRPRVGAKCSFPRDSSKAGLGVCGGLQGLRLLNYLASPSNLPFSRNCLSLLS